MAKNFESLGVMIDMSRNAVMSLDGIKNFLPLLKRMGYNCVLLYMEDTYEVDGLPYFGYMRGRYTKEEMKIIDEYASSIGIEIIPCIQTLAHLNGTLRWGEIPVDCDDILLVDDDKTTDVIDKMFATLSQCFKTRRIHIGMDEAHMLGRGKHLDIHGYETANSIIRRHLRHVTEIAKKYNYELMIWSDMFFRPWNNGAYYTQNVGLPDEVLGSIPESVIPVYWDYYHLEEQTYDAMIKNHKLLSDKTWFAGGAWSWGGFAPHNRFSIEAMKHAIHSCKKNHIKNVFFTMWGDDGAECSRYALLPSLFYISQLAKGNEDIELIKSRFKRLAGIEFDEFMKLDSPNDLAPFKKRPLNPCKHMLYSDYFNGFLDYTVMEGGGEKYKLFAKELHAIAKKNRRYGYLFTSLGLLCDVLELKYELGVKTRRAYRSGDKAELLRLAKEDYTEVEKRIRAFGNAFEKQWFKENKPCGFDVQDIRIGAILRRTMTCKRRLIDYANGKINDIPELQEELLPFGTESYPIYVNNARQYMTTNILTQN